MPLSRTRIERQVTKTFEQVSALEDMTHENDEAWTSTLMPPNDGFVLVKHNENLDLRVGISMFHALHCLSLVRAVLQDIPSPTHRHGSLGPRGKAGSEHFLQKTHLPHCLMYIAQSLMCAGDSTLEPSWLRTDKDGNIVLHGVDGLGVQHQCKDTKSLWDAARRSSKGSIQPWGWKAGDTVESVFG
ncbi:Piwi domain family protein [Apiospora aurea]|uniref:Piwi domain family protein n=1 Tax=Apiospora aurea TaxID=335848 RepID=A0ABR1Q0N1_9PEZI